MRKLKMIQHISLDGVIQVSGEDGRFPLQLFHAVCRYDAVKGGEVHEPLSVWTWAERRGGSSQGQWRMLR